MFLKNIVFNHSIPSKDKATEFGSSPLQDGSGTASDPLGPSPIQHMVSWKDLSLSRFTGVMGLTNSVLANIDLG